MTAIKWADGFDNYGSVKHMLNGAWSSTLLTDVSIKIRPGGATGPSCLSLTANANCRRYLGGDFDKVVLGFRVWLTALPSNGDHTFALASVLSATGVALWTLSVLPSGRIRILPGRNNAAPLATSTRAMAGGVWNHVEIMFDKTAGTVSVRLQGREIVSAASAAASQMSDVFFGNWDPGSNKVFVDTYYDDMVASAGDAADFLGMVGVFYLPPNADNVPQDWDYTSGNNGYVLINELDPDDDQNYIFSETVGDTATFGTTQLPSNVTSVVAVIPIARTRKSDTGPCDIALAVKSGDTVLEAEDFPLTTGYSYHWAVFETDPVTGERWNPSALPDILVRRTL